jgi:hypothetical protein
MLHPIWKAKVLAPGLPVRITAILSERWTLAHLPNGSEVKVFGLPIEGRHQTTYRALFCPLEPLHGCFVVESIGGVKLLQIFEMEGVQLATVG